MQKDENFMTTIQAGDTVTIHYTTKSLEGCVIETSHSRNPLTFEAGGGGVIRGLSEGVIGMTVGEQARLALPPQRAFGKRRPDLVQEVPRRLLPEKVDQGDQLLIEASQVVFEAAVLRKQESTMVIDANHPLSDETLVVDVEIIDVHQ